MHAMTYPLFDTVLNPDFLRVVKEKIIFLPLQCILSPTKPGSQLQVDAFTWQLCVLFEHAYIRQ